MPKDEHGAVNAAIAGRMERKLRAHEGHRTESERQAAVMSRLEAAALWLASHIEGSRRIRGKDYMLFSSPDDGHLRESLRDMELSGKVEYSEKEERWHARAEAAPFLRQCQKAWLDAASIAKAAGIPHETLFASSARSM